MSQAIFLENKKIFFDSKLPDGFEETAQLRDDLWPSFVKQHQVNGNFAGTGSDLDKSTACYKAMSEAIERWAFAQSKAQIELCRNFYLLAQISPSKQV